MSKRETIRNSSDAMIKFFLEFCGECFLIFGAIIIGVYMIKHDFSILLGILFILIAIVIRKAVR